MQTGTIDPVAKTFDIYNVNESDTSILLTNTQLSFTYRDEAGQLIKLSKPVSKQLGGYVFRKTISDPRAVIVGTSLAVSSVKDSDNKSGFLVPGDGKAKAMMSVDWSADVLSKQEFTDSNGESRVAVSLPLSL